MSEDISFGGLFVCTDARPEPGRLVRVDVTLSGAAESLLMHAMVAHVRDAEPRGVGLQFYGIGEEQRGRWARYVNDVRSQSNDSERPDPGGQEERPQAVKASPPSAPADHVSLIKVRPRTRADLLRLYTCDVSTGATFVQTDQPVVAGDEVYIVVVHPDSGKPFCLRGRVQRLASHGDVRGAVIKLVATNEATRRAFWQFVGIDDIATGGLAGQQRQQDLEVVADPDDIFFKSPEGEADTGW